jgi:hypothetical protein
MMIKKYRVYDIQYEMGGQKIDLPKELLIDLSLESDGIDNRNQIDEMLGSEISDKTGWLHNGFSFEEFKEKQKVFVVMIDDVAFDARHSIQECIVWTTKEKAVLQLKKVADSYKKSCCAEPLKNKCVGFTENTKKDYVMTESEEHFTFYENGRRHNNHIEVWILEKELN